MKSKIAAGLQVAGAVSFVVAGFLVHAVAGFGVAGVLGLVFGIALEREVAGPSDDPVTEPDDVAPVAGEKPQPFPGDA